MRSRRRLPRRAPIHGPLGPALPAALLVAALVGAGCSNPILANPPLDFPTPPVPTEAPRPQPDPIPVVLPRDDGPHDRLTEWWYYTGHLMTDTGRRFGFEAVVFRAERGPVPVGWASHLALTDESGQSFHYAQRSEIGPQVDRSPRAQDGVPVGFDLQVSGLNPALVAAGAPVLAPTAWRLAGADGADRIEAALTEEEAAAAGASFGLALDLEAVKPAALHDGDGFVDFGPAGSSYYYSRTRLDASGELTLDGERFDVTGIAWFDHQWGDFISVGGGWDWFAINLDDGQDITVSVVRDDAGEPVLTYGTLVDEAGSVRHLTDADVTIRETASWTSDATGRRYPATWRVTFPELERRYGLFLDLTPTVADQELDARATTGVIYWEGSHHVLGWYGGPGVVLSDASGQAYVELTRYDGPPR